MKNKILSWYELVKYLRLFPSTERIKDISGLITQCRLNGIGIPVSYQKTRYSDKDLKLIKKIIKWWVFLTQKSNEEFRDQYTSKAIANAIIHAVIFNKPLIIYSVFCPSYRKGIGAIGYTGMVGDYTQKMIIKYINFIYGSNQLGVNTSGKVYFSDLLLENYQKLKNTTYEKDLRSNYIHFRKLFRKKDYKKLISVSLLSRITYFRKNIGKEGITRGPINIPPEIFNVVRERNSIFYKKVLGWSEKQVIERTKILARCYSFMGDYFRKKFPYGIMYWVESAYERGRMYHGNHQKLPIPIIYPRKNDEQSLIF